MTEAEWEQPADEPEVFWGLQRDHMECPSVLEIVVEGDPASKARPRFTGRGYKGRAYTPEKTKQAEEAIATAARAQLGADYTASAEGTYGLLTIFFCRTFQRRDVDNLIKLVGDALNKVVWADDSQVSEVSGRLVRGDNLPRTHILVYRTIAPVAPTRPCRVCKKPVRQYASQPNNFCSRVCFGIGGRNRVTFTCRTCGKQSEVTAYQRDSRVYCDKTCRWADPSPRVRQARELLPHTDEAAHEQGDVADDLGDDPVWPGGTA